MFVRKKPDALAIWFHSVRFTRVQLRPELALGPLELHGFNYRLSAAQLACRIDPVEVAVTVGMKFRAPMRLVELLEEYLSSSVPRGHVADVIDELVSVRLRHESQELVAE